MRWRVCDLYGLAFLRIVSMVCFNVECNGLVDEMEKQMYRKMGGIWNARGSDVSHDQHLKSAAERVKTRTFLFIPVNVTNFSLEQTRHAISDTVHVQQWMITSP